MKRLTLTFLALVMWASVAHAQGLPEEDRDPDTVRWLAVAFVAEAGWAPPERPKGEVDHRAIFHALANRWPQLQRRNARYFARFKAVVRSYVAAMDPRTEKGARVRWLLRLRPGMIKAPMGWPDRARWDVHRVLWDAVVARAQRCVDGVDCADPYKGKAYHWGSTADGPQGCMVALPNAGTLNTYYFVDMDCKRRRRRRKS